MTSDAIVVGGGVIGCSIAWELAKSGLKVTLFERGALGEEASWAAAGMLGPHSEARVRTPFFELGLRSLEMYPRFAAELEDASGESVDYRTDGGLFVEDPNASQPDEESGRAQGADWADWQLDQGFGLERMTSDDMTKLEPALSTQAASGIFIPGDHQVDNRRLMRALRLALHRAGIEVREGSEVTSVAIDSDKVQGVICRTEEFAAPEVIIAAGCWSPALLKPAGLTLDVIPARGQMLAVRGPALRHCVHTSGCYLVPRRDGRILIGATVEYAGFHKAVTIDGMSNLISAAVRMVPAIAVAEIVETWSGLRPDSPDHLPIIGPTGVDGLTLATGHFRNGILLAPVTSRLIADSVVNKRTSPELTPFSIARFTATPGAGPPKS